MNADKKNNIDIFILARLGSKRLPKKQFKKIGRNYSLKVLINRLKKAKNIRNIVVCTTNKTYDDPLVNFLKREKILFFRGSEKDVLDRMLKAAKYYSTDIIIDVEGDKVYTDPKLVDHVVKEFINPKTQFVIGSKNGKKFELEDHFIHGVMPTGFKTTVLEKLCHIKKTKNTETGYKEMFFLTGLTKKKFLKLPTKIEISKEVRLTLDYKEDLELAKKIFKFLGQDFSYKDIIHLYTKNPKIFEATKEISKKWGKNYQISKNKH